MKKYHPKPTRSFSELVSRAVRKIPRGETRTYQEVARLAGSPRAYRAVGNILGKNYDPAIPCHRVIRSNGGLGNYNRGGTMQKRKILRAEGATIVRFYLRP